MKLKRRIVSDLNVVILNFFVEFPSKMSFYWRKARKEKRRSKRYYQFAWQPILNAKHGDLAATVTVVRSRYIGTSRYIYLYFVLKFGLCGMYGLEVLI